MKTNAQDLKTELIESIGKQLPEKIHFIFQENHAEIVHEESSVSFSGVIDSPLNWVKQRLDSIDQKNSHVVVTPDKLKIVLVTEERNHFKNTITGELVLDETFKEFGINVETFREAKHWAKLFKKHKYAFASLTKANEIILALLNFKAKVSESVEKAKDAKGNVTDNYQREVIENTLPSTFEIKLPIFKGQQAIEFDVEFEVNENDLSLSLWSDFVQIEQKSVRDKSIQEVIEGIQAIAPGIVVLYN